MDDKRLTELYFERSETAISETDKKYGRLCRYITNSILENREDSEECVSDTYLSLWNSIPPTRPVSFRAYLLRTARNISLKKLDFLSAEKRGGGKLPVFLDEIAEMIPDRDAESDLDSTIVKDTVNRFLSGLPKEKRIIFVRRYFYMNSVKEIAKEYGISESKVKTSLFRMREELREKLKKEGVNV